MGATKKSFHVRSVSSTVKKQLYERVLTPLVQYEEFEDGADHRLDAMEVKCQIRMFKVFRRGRVRN